MTISQFLHGCPVCGGTGYVYDEAILGPHLRTRRKETQISQKDMASVLGISAQYLNDLEQGKRRWSDKRASEYVTELARRRGGQ